MNTILRQMRLVGIFVCMSSMVMRCTALTNQEFFLQANAAYATHDYAKAFELYNAITSKGPVTWYNMGNCAYHLKRHTDAYLYWKKSEQGAAWQLLQDAEYNILFLTQGAASEQPVSWYQKVKQLMHRYSVGLSLGWLQFLLALIWFLFWVLYMHYASRFLHGTFLLLICCCGIALKGKYHEMTTKKGIVIRTPVVVHAGPDRQFHAITSVDALAEITIVDATMKKDWYKISYKDQIGWVPADSVNSV